MNHRFLLIALTLLALFALAACATPTEAPKPTSAQIGRASCRERV